MNLSYRFGVFHLSVMGMFAPLAVVAQAMKFQRNVASPWPHISPPQAGKLLKRRFDFQGCNIEVPARIVWTVPEANEAWHQEFYSFRWIHELAASNNQKAAGSFIREFINGFIMDERDLTEAAWDVNIVGARLAVWMQYRSFILKGGSKVFRRRFGRSLLKHIRVIRIHLEEKPQSVGLTALHGVMSAATQIADVRFLLPSAEARLAHVLEEVVLADGCHFSASPERHLEALRTLIDIRLLITAESSVYSELAQTIVRMGRVLMFFCHGDGRLALFHQSLMGDANIITVVKELASATDSIPEWLRQAGFVRLSQQRTRVITAVAAQGEMQVKHWPESALALELSEGAERIIVNCGFYRGNSPMWSAATHSSDVYSTLSLFSTAPEIVEDASVTSDVDDEHNAEEGTESHTLPPPPSQEVTPQVGDATREKEPVRVHSGTSGVFCEAVNEAYIPSHGISHARNLHLSRKGDVLSGRDILLQVDADKAHHVVPVIRFHLHPDVRCHRLKGGIVELKSLSGKCWHFSATSGVDVSVSESVYLGYYGKPQKTLQIVLQPVFKGEKTMISWQFKRVNVAPSEQ